MNKLSTAQQDTSTIKTSLKAVGECLAVIKELHPGWKFDKYLTPKLWHDALKSYPEQVVKRAVLDIASTSKYVPKLADVLEEIKTMYETHEQSLAVEYVDQKKELSKRADEWFYSLSETERNEMNVRIEHYLATGQGELNEFESHRANQYKNIRELLQED